jgi:hypothetical protein
LDTSFFKLEIQSLVDIDRDVMVTLDNFSANILVRNMDGSTEIDLVTAAPTTMLVHIPAPGAAGLLALGGLMAARRRR